MAGPLRLLAALNPIAGVSLAIILAGLIARGANTASTAALLSGVLAAAALVAVALFPSRTLRRVLAQNAAPACAAIAFVLIAGLSAAPLVSPALAASFAHPAAAQFMWSPPAMSLSPSSTLGGIVMFVGPMAAFTLGLLANASGSRSQIGAWLCIFALLYALHALALYFAGQGQSGSRLDAHIGSANAAAAVFGMLALFASARTVGRTIAARRRKGPARLQWALALAGDPLGASAFALAVVCALLTVSRGGLAATLVAFAVFGALLMLQPGGRLRSAALVSALGLAALGLGLFALGAEPAFSRLADAGDAVDARQQLLAAHWDAFLARPLWGNGLNTFHELNAMAGTPENWSNLRVVGAAHNIYVQLLEETGLVGALLFALMLGPPALRALSSALSDRDAPQWGAALYGATILFMIHGTMDFALQIPAVSALFAFCLGAFSTSSAQPQPPMNM